MMQRHLTRAMITLALVMATSLTARGTQASGVQVISATELGKPVSSLSRSPASGTSHRHVRQRQEYGKGYRYGHSVSGARGNITIWSAKPYQGYGSRPHASQRSMNSVRPSPPTGPRLEYKPQYGKDSSPEYGD